MSFIFGAFFAAQCIVCTYSLWPIACNNLKLLLGGEIFFADESGKYAMVGAEPKCGRLVGFCAGTECLHGVKKLKKGERCALPVWFTTRKERLDFTLKEAQRIIDQIDQNKTL